MCNECDDYGVGGGDVLVCICKFEDFGCLGMYQMDDVFKNIDEKQLDIVLI